MSKPTQTKKAAISQKDRETYDKAKRQIAASIKANQHLIDIQHEARQPVESTQIEAGDKVVHADQYGVSAGIAASDPMTSRGEIKVRFTFGPRKGECRWIKLNQIRSVEQGANAWE